MVSDIDQQNIPIGFKTISNNIQSGYLIFFYKLEVVHQSDI